MALFHDLTVPSSLLFLLFFLVSGGLVEPPQVRAQQPYGKEIDDCNNQHNSSGMLGYFCNSGSSPSCQTFLTFTAAAPYSNLSSIASLLNADPTTLAAANDLVAGATLAAGTRVLIPATCGCTTSPDGGRFYQRNTTYVAKSGDTLQNIATGTFQGLTTCQSLEAQALRGAAPASLQVGQSLSPVPLRCACPSSSQLAAGKRFLVSYLVAEFDDVSTVAGRFGVDVEAITAANELQSPYTIFPSTTLLIPVTAQPNVSRIQTPASPPPPPPVGAPPPPGKKKSSNRVGVYIGVAVAVVAVAAIAAAGGFLALKARRKRASAVLAAGDVEKKEGKGKDSNTNTNTTSSAFFSGAGGEFSLSTSEAFSSISVADIKSSLRVYTYTELESATDGFSSDRHIGGSVYLAAFAGDAAAVEVVDRNVSTEVEIMRQINHLNLIRLIGLCHHHGRWYLVTEFAEHGALRDRLRRRSPPPLTWPQRLQVGLDVAEGLRYLHEYARPRCVHMDVSSGAILLAGDDEHPRAKLRSFGAARAITGGGEEEEEVVFTMTSRIAGTRGYMAPEYLEHGVVSAKADVYSLGVVLLELLTGKDAEELVGEGVGDPFVDLRELAEELDGGGGGDGVMQRMEELVDPAMAAGSCPQEGVVEMVRLIERCVRRGAAGRPTTGEVARRLLKMSGVSAVSWRNNSSPESPRSPGR